MIFKNHNQNHEVTWKTKLLSQMRMFGVISNSRYLKTFFISKFLLSF